MPACDSACELGACVSAKSCGPGPSVCGDDSASCCKSIGVEAAATFEMPYVRRVISAGQKQDDPDQVTRTVRPFALDRFEVTVDRFAAFMAVFDHARKPAARSGAHPAFPNSGWQSAWSAAGGPVAPTVDTLTKELRGQHQLFNAADGGDLPIRGVNWYVAFAFCIWDGGRLPTEAEWAYAALNGERLIYPWRDENGVIDHGHAVYTDDAGVESGPRTVGSHHLGATDEGHEDLAGNLEEWVADSYEETIPPACDEIGRGQLDEHECLIRRGEEFRVVRGGSFLDAPEQLRNVERTPYDPASGRWNVGFRCARDLKAR